MNEWLRVRDVQFFKSVIIKDKKAKLKKKKAVKVVKHSKASMKMQIEKQKTHHKETT